MRVAFVAAEVGRGNPSPAARRTRRTARLLADRGHEVTVCSARWWKGDADTVERDGVTYRAAADDATERGFARRLPFALRAADPDVVQVGSSSPSHVVAAGRAGKLLRVPLVVDWWDAPEGGADGARRVIGAADRVLVPSRTVKTQVRERGADADLVRVVPESIDFSLVREAPVDDRADLVYARRLDEYANVETFLLALAELRDRTWRAVVVGDGPARADAERTARDLRIDGRVEFLGDLPARERVPVLKGAHVFAQTAYYEPFATDLLWALACGCLGVVEYQAASSAHELLEGTDRGRFVSSPEELADEIVAAADVERRSIAESYARYDHATVLNEYVDCYETVREEYGWL